MTEVCCFPDTAPQSPNHAAFAIAKPRSSLRRLARASLLSVRSADRVVLCLALMFAALSIFSPRQAVASLILIRDSFASLAPWLVASVLFAAATKATGGEGIISRAFSGHQAKAIAGAALLGSLSAFCSCGVIPIIAGLLAAGVPLGPVMAFWLSSPLMDPELFVLISVNLGVGFAVAKALAAIGIGLFGGYAAMAMTRAGLLKDVLRTAPRPGCGAQCAGDVPVAQRPVWRFWLDPVRAQTFLTEASKTGWFLARWLAVAYFLESLMAAYVPHETIARLVGGRGLVAVPVAVLLGIPTYLNAYAAIPLVKGLIGLGMNPAAGLAFMISGAGSSIPAAIAVWALVKPRVFALYVALGLTGAIGAGYIYALAL